MRGDERIRGRIHHERSDNRCDDTVYQLRHGFSFSRLFRRLARVPAPGFKKELLSALQACYSKSGREPDRLACPRKTSQTWWTWVRFTPRVVELTPLKKKLGFNRCDPCLPGCGSSFAPLASLR